MHNLMSIISNVLTFEQTIRAMCSHQARDKLLVYYTYTFEFDRVISCSTYAKKKINVIGIYLML